ncbi:MAG: hypothetical protein ACREPM_03115, partial [Gemmatimonadaceae bacterium]
MTRPVRATIAGTLAIVAAGCASPRGVAVAGSPRACAVDATMRVPPESLSVATTTPISPSHAPNPTNDGERFVFAQLYETLINVACDGTPYAGLARSWTIDATKTRVTLVLRDDAHFWSGDPVRASDVVAAWRASGARLADATTIDDDRTLTVSLPDTEWLVLAAPPLSVYRRSAVSPWPLGSGSYRVVEPASDAAPGRLGLVSIAPNVAPRLAVRSGPDARDAIDAGADLLPTADAMAVRYAAARPNLTSVPLPWLRTYLLAVPSRAPGSVVNTLSRGGYQANAFRTSLARDAVRADARAVTDWPENPEVCDNVLTQSPAIATTPRQQRVVYRGDDPVARGIAERLVAVGGHATATPLAPADFARALYVGSELAYVVVLPRASLTPCRELSAHVAAAPWLGAGAALADALVPLIDTRERAIVDRARVSAGIDWDGTL